MDVLRQLGLILTVCLFVHWSVGEGLDDYIHVYDAVNYNADELHNLHVRHKRSTHSIINMEIQGFGKNFKLNLKKDSSIFHPDFEFILGKETIRKADLSFLYTGTVEGHPGSSVDGAIIEGIFRGSIRVPSENETYHVEKSRRFFDSSQDFHSVIYKESQMDLDPYRERRMRERREAADNLVHSGGCGYHQAQDWMEKVVSSEVRSTEKEAERVQYDWQGVNTGQFNKYTSEMNEGQDQPVVRKKRAVRALTEGTCYLFLRADPIFWNRYLAKSDNVESVARDEILAFFTSHVNAINTIYKDTIFATYSYDTSIQDSFTGIMFGVRRTLVMTYMDSCQSTRISAFCNENIDVSNLLNLNSLDNHDDYCLAYVFTYRDFTQGTLGLAWVGASNTASGGICEKNKPFREGGVTVDKSLNTGVVTTINYGKEVPSRVSQLTFAHEVGHNFGSPHDSGPECSPYGTSRPDASSGNFIMFASATMGDKQNNNRFSICSKDNITRVLYQFFKQNPTKTNCFEASGQAYCGNGLVEEGEQCDCGFEDECSDRCCVARKTDGDNSLMCWRTPNVDCSPSEGPCCTNNCEYVNNGANQTCRYSTDCIEEAKCSGATATCPESVQKADGSYCNNYGFICVKGECAGSLCDQFGWTECFTTGPSKTKTEQEKLCRLSCVQDNATECILSSNPPDNSDYKRMVEQVIAGRKDGSLDVGIELAAGSPCNDFQGYCDVFHRCRGVDAEGPLARLKNLIFSQETLETISNWIVEHWWAVLLMAIGLIVAMGLFIKFCAVHTPSSNPKAKPARKLSETMTLRRRRNQHQQGQPQQVRYPQNPQGPPPPYPGSSSGGPPHGHGKKGRKTKDIEMGRI